MNRLLIILIALFLLVPFAHAEQNLSVVEIRPDYDRYRLSTFKVRLYPETYLEIWLDFGVEGGEYDPNAHRRIRITDRDISYNGANLFRDDQDGNMPGLPAGYVATPATKILQEVNAGTFDGQGSLSNYLEIIVKTIFGF